jgi:hypothetical protein
MVATHARLEALESLLRSRKLDRTLTSALPVTVSTHEYAAAATGVASLDARLQGGFPRGQLSELVGTRSSGRMSVVLQLIAAATARGEAVALVDGLDMLDVGSAEAAGIDLARLLWLRGHVVTNPGMCRDTNARAVDHVVKALTLVLQSGLFGVVVLDLAEAPSDAVRRLPFTTWMRLQRLIEGTDTACVLVGSERLARSSAGLTIKLGPTGTDGGGAVFQGHLFHGLTADARVVRARSHTHTDAATTVETVASHCA